MISCECRSMCEDHLTVGYVLDYGEFDIGQRMFKWKVEVHIPESVATTTELSAWV